MNKPPKKMVLNDTAIEIATIDQADVKVDAQIKKVLACKPILAVILKETVNECSNMSLFDIEQCIEGDPQISKVPVLPMSEKIVGQSQEDYLQGEGMVRYDIKTVIQIPGENSSTEIKIIIDVEAQLKDKTGYDLPLRALFYCSRLISSQLGVEFSNNNDDPVKYGNIKKVYSIWICSCTADKRANSVDKYSIDRKTIIGANNDDPRYDIMCAVIINIGKKYDSKGSTSRMVQMLNSLLDSTKTAEDKIKELQTYGVRMTKEVEKEVVTMSTYSAELLEKGIEQGIEATIVKLLKKGNSPEFISENLEIPMETILQIRKKINI